MTTTLSREHLFESGLFNFGFSMDEANLRVRTEQLRTRMGMYPFLVLSQIIIEPLFVWMLWGHASHQMLLLWLAVIYALHLVELFKWALHRDQLNTLPECKAWNSHFTNFSLAAGLLWGGRCGCLLSERHRL